VRAGRCRTISIGPATVAERRSRPVAAFAGAAVLLTILASCSDGTADTAASPATADEASSHSADPEAIPAPTSGDLGQDDLPAPEDLGRDWKYRVDLGNAEDGYVGSGEPATARDPETVMAALTPLGCRPVPLPTPTRALEVTYERGQTPGVGLILQFVDGSTAAQFFNSHADGLRRCVGAPRIDVEILRDAPGTFVSTRTEELGETPTWVEGMTVTANEVTLIAVADPSKRGVSAVVGAVT
jgi:hypothetical protein